MNKKTLAKQAEEKEAAVDEPVSEEVSEVTEEAAVPEPLLQLTRNMWRNFGWLTSSKLRQQLYRYEAGGVPPETESSRQ